MDNAYYTTLTRQAGLLQEMQSVANNIANMSTTGYRKEGVIFAEYIAKIEDAPSLSMATARVRDTSFLQGATTQTGGNLDLAIQGDGFFLIETPQGERLTRAGNFTVNGQGDMVTQDGFPVLDAGGAPIFIPPSTDIAISSDGTISAGDAPLGQIGLHLPIDPTEMTREGSVLFNAPGGTEPMDAGIVLQGFLESSNVDPVTQITRMIEVQRAYELGQNFLDKEDERMRSVMQTLGR